MKDFAKDFKTLQYILDRSERVLLVAHNRPDPDTIGATAALEEYIARRGKAVDIACYHPFPENIRILVDKNFLHPDQLNLSNYDTVIACDSVDRGFHEMKDLFTENQVIVLIDHHFDISIEGDVTIIEPEYSSTAEIIYLFLTAIDAPITKSMATALLMGVLFDTGGFQHANVSPRVMEIASELMKKGAPLTRIAQTIFSHKNISALKLWGKAFEKARFNPKNGMIVTAITRKDVEECQASVEDIYQVTSILSAVPDARFALVLSERDDNMIRASLRSMGQHGVDVSSIAHSFGGGGHKLSSGFEIPGRIIETPRGWQIA